MAKTAYIKIQPQFVQFCLEKRLSVTLDEDKTRIRLSGAGSSNFTVAIEDIDWLKQALEDMQEFIKIPDEK